MIERIRKLIDNFARARIALTKAEPKDQIAFDLFDSV